MEIIIRKYVSINRDQCLSAFKSNVPEYFTIDEIGEFIEWLDDLNSQVISQKDSRNDYYVLLSARTIVGCGGFVYDDKTNEATLAWGFIGKAFHGKGFGEKLLFYRLRQIKILSPEASILLDTTQFSCSFFEKYGFVTQKITRDYYAPEIHRYDMVLKA